MDGPFHKFTWKYLLKNGRMIFWFSFSCQFILQVDYRCSNTLNSFPGNVWKNNKAKYLVLSRVLWSNNKNRWYYCLSYKNVPRQQLKLTQKAHTAFHQFARQWNMIWMTILTIKMANNLRDSKFYSCFILQKFVLNLG